MKTAIILMSIGLIIGLILVIVTNPTKIKDGELSMLSHDYKNEREKIFFRVMLALMIILFSIGYGLMISNLPLALGYRLALLILVFPLCYVLILLAKAIFYIIIMIISLLLEL